MYFFYYKILCNVIVCLKLFVTYILKDNYFARPRKISGYALDLERSELMVVNNPLHPSLLTD